MGPVVSGPKWAKPFSREPCNYASILDVYDPFTCRSHFIFTSSVDLNETFLWASSDLLF